MRIDLSPTDGRPIYLQIMDEVRRALVVGTLSPGDPLPSVRELASSLRLNPRTVSQAYQELEREGLVYVRRGQGTFVASVARPDRAAVARTVARRAMLDAHRHGIGVEDLIAAIEDEAVSQAATHAGEVPGKDGHE